MNNYLLITSNIDFRPFIFLAALLVFLFIFIYLSIFFLRRYLKKNNFIKQVVFLVKLPKEKPEDEKTSFSTQQLIEEISKGETVFSSIGGLKAQRGFRSWLFGRDDHFSFEILASDNKIAFYVVANQINARYLEQQIHANYPSAFIEEVEDYNMFKADSQVMAAYLKTKKDYIFPLKTYKEMSTDPMNSLINVLSKLDKDESIAIQYVVRSSHSSWHSRVRKIVSNINKENSIEAGIDLSSGTFNFFKNLNAIIDFFFSSKKNDDSLDKRNEEIKKLTSIEQETLKKIEEKNSKAGLDVNLRIITSTKSKERCSIYLDNLANAFSEYNNFSYGNYFFRLNTKKSKLDRHVNSFIYRKFDDRYSFLLNTEELTSLFHFPLKSTETPNILWLNSKIAPAPANIPDEGIILGKNMYRGVEREIRIKREDRRRHTYLVGKSGTGKSVALANMAIQDIQNGEGVCVIDPNGDLIQDILERIPPARAEDVILFSPADIERPLGLNLLDYDPAYPEQKSFVINEMIGIFDKLYDLKSTGGPMFEQYMRNAMLLVMDDVETGATLMEIPKVLSDENFRRLKISKCKNQTVVDFWIKEAEKAGGEAALANIAPYITSKLTSFISNDMMRPIIGQQKSAFNFRDLMDKQKILLIDLPKGLIGEMNAYLLGMILVGKILMAALSRTDIKPEERKDFYLYIDEFQNFTTNSICQILSEARKYALNLIIAHQYIGQLTKNNNTEIKDAIFGNVGTMISFKVGSEDANFLIKDFSPVFNEYDLVNIDKGMACIKLLIDNSSSRPFTLKGIWPLLGEKRPEFAERIKNLSRLKYGQNNKLIEAEIKKRNI